MRSPQAQKVWPETSKDETPKPKVVVRFREWTNKSVTVVADEKSQAQKVTETSKDETPKAQSSSESVESEANKSVTVVARWEVTSPKKWNRDI